MEKIDKKILIIEDDQTILFSLVEKFKLIEGVQIFYAEDGEEGLEIALKEKPNIVLLDIILSKMNGVELLKKLRQDEWGKDALVVVLSNISNPEKEIEIKGLGVENYYVKAETKINDIIVKIQELWS